MQALDVNLVSALIGFLGAILGGVVTRFVIRWMDAEEREREGAFSALLGITFAHELIQSYPEGTPSSTQLSVLEDLRKDSVRLLVTAAGKVHKDLRGDLYLLGMLLQRKLTKINPTGIRKKNINKRIKSIEKRIKTSYLGSGHKWKELVLSVEEMIERLGEDTKT